MRPYEADHGEEGKTMKTVTHTADAMVILNNLTHTADSAVFAAVNTLTHTEDATVILNNMTHTADSAVSAPAAKQQSRLSQWPVQIKLVPVNAAFFKGAKLLIAADCTAYAYAGFHEDFIRGRVTLIGCPKLDGVNYTDKLTDIISSNDIREVLIVRMEVPCCGGLELAAKNALKASGKFIPWNVVTIASDGRIVD